MKDKSVEKFIGRIENIAKKDNSLFAPLINNSHYSLLTIFNAYNGYIASKLKDLKEQVTNLEAKISESNGVKLKIDYGIIRDCIGENLEIYISLEDKETTIKIPFRYLEDYYTEDGKRKCNEDSLANTFTWHSRINNDIELPLNPFQKASIMDLGTLYKNITKDLKKFSIAYDDIKYFPISTRYYDANKYLCITIEPYFQTRKPLFLDISLIPTQSIGILQQLYLFYGKTGTFLEGFYKGNNTSYNKVPLNSNNALALERVFDIFKVKEEKIPDFLIPFLKSNELSQEDDKDALEIKKKFEGNKAEISKLVKENQRLAAALNIRRPITKEELLREVSDKEDRYFVIKEEYKDCLALYDLSNISFDNVDIRGIDFRNTNINSLFFNLQKLYKKDISGCNFSVDEENSKDYIFGLNDDFTDVNLKGTKMYNPFPCCLNYTIYQASMDEFTVLPDTYAENIESIENDGKVKRKTLY